MVIVRRDQQAKNAELREEVQLLRTVIEEYEADVEAEVNASKAQIDASKAEVNALKAEIDASKAEVNGLKAEITASKAEAEALHDELSIREIVSSAVNGATDHDFELQIKNMEDDIATYQADIRALVAELHAKDINHTLGNSVIDDVSDDANDEHGVYRHQNEWLFGTGTLEPCDFEHGDYRHQNNSLFGEHSPGHIDFENSIGFRLSIGQGVCSSEDLHVAPCSAFAPASPSMLENCSPQLKALTSPDMVLDSSSFFGVSDGDHCCFDASINPDIACDLPLPLSFTPRSPTADAFPPYCPTTPNSDAAIPKVSDGDSASYPPTTPTLNPAFPAMTFESSPGYGLIFPILTPKKLSPLVMVDRSSCGTPRTNQISPYCSCVRSPAPDQALPVPRTGSTWTCR